MTTKTAPATLEPKALQVASPPPPPAVIDAGALLAQGIQQGLSVDALERLLGMRRELQAEQAKADFFAALASFQAKIPPITKSQTARVQSAKGTFSYRYADLGDIQRAIAPTLAACGLSVTFDTTQDQGGYTIVAKVHHTSGHSEATTFRVPVDTTARMNSAQAAPTRTPPTVDAGPHPAQQPGGPKGGTSQSASQKRRLEARIQELGLAPYRDRIKDWTLKRWGIGSLADLTSDQNADLFDRLDDFAERIAIETDAAA
jgi:hypothetical protein